MIEGPRTQGPTFARQDMKQPTVREATGWTIVWVVLALVFNGVVYLLYEYNYSWVRLPTEHLDGSQAAAQFMLGYFLEKSLSLDNIFVIAMIFAHFRIPLVFQHRILFWGILGAVVLRGIMITMGVALFHHAHRLFGRRGRR